MEHVLHCTEHSICALGSLAQMRGLVSWPHCILVPNITERECVFQGAFHDTTVPATNFLQVLRLMRMLVQICQTLDRVPAEACGVGLRARRA
jgi:hypothetical protein